MVEPLVSMLGGSGPVAVAAAAGLFGGFVRGFSGFGFALAAVPVLTLALTPAEAVPAVLPLEVLLGLAMVPGQRRHVSWPALRWLVAGTLLGTPLGLAVLASAPAPLMRAAVGAVVLAAVAILWRRPDVPGLLRPPWLSLSGFISGCLNGGTAMSGPPAIIALLGSPLSGQAARATLMAFITVSATLAAAVALANGLYGGRSMAATAVMIPAGLAGGTAGAVVFGRVPDPLYRRASLAMLVGIMLVALGVSAWTLAGSSGH